MSHASSTREIPAAGDVPRHVAIIMDGNGHWAKGRRLHRSAHGFGARFVSGNAR